MFRREYGCDLSLVVITFRWTKCMSSGNIVVGRLELGIERGFDNITGWRGEGSRHSRIWQRFVASVVVTSES